MNARTRCPVYNFGVPWIEQIARTRVTFRDPEPNPKGLLEGKMVYILTAACGTEVAARSTSPPLAEDRVGLPGISDVEVIAADRQHATARIDALIERAGQPVSQPDATARPSRFPERRQS